MAKKEKKERYSFFKSNRIIKNNLDLLDKSLDDLYNATYADSKYNYTNAKNIRDNIDNHIDNIMANTYSDGSVGNLTKLYSKLVEKNGTNNDVLSAVQDMFNDQAVSANILSTWMEQKWIKDRDKEIDIILKYVPRLKEALACKKDCVISADHFAKDFVSYHSISISDKNKDQIFSKRMEELKRVYKLPEKYEDWYDEAQTYGECFVYVAPYTREFEKLLKSRTTGIVTQTIGESTVSIIENGKFTGSNMECDVVQNFTVSINTTGLLKSSAEAISKARTIEEAGIISMSSIFEESVNMLQEKSLTIDNNLIPDDLSMPDKDDENSFSSEMIVNKYDSKENSEKISVPGCIVKTLERANVIPIDIDDVRIGYWYIEVVGNTVSDSNIDPNSFNYTPGATNTISGINAIGRDNQMMQQENKDKILRLISQKLNDVIDASFINANQDLRNELYQILKHNSLLNSPENVSSGNITITFLSAEDVTHICFKKDPITKRGISDLAYAIFPANLYACLYITNTLGILTRGMDKRVYYVKQTVEKNVAKTMLTVLNQIKKGNFGSREMENLSSVLNITGRFNDYLIPMSQSGDAPIQFEVMPGQQYNDISELMHGLEKMAIDTTEIPYDLIEARQSLDYAIQATMTNSKLMRTCYKRQDITEIFYSAITSKIYNYEYNEKEKIEISLPAPAFLNVTNGSQLLNGTIDYANTIASTELAGESEEVQNEYKKLALRYYIPSHLNISANEKLIKQAKINVAKRAVATAEEEEE